MKKKTQKTESKASKKQSLRDLTALENRAANVKAGARARKTRLG